jgi:hypothetical protein
MFLRLQILTSGLKSQNTRLSSLENSNGGFLILDLFQLPASADMKDKLQKRLAIKTSFTKERTAKTSVG